MTDVPQPHNSILYVQEFDLYKEIQRLFKKANFKTDITYNPSCDSSTSTLFWIASCYSLLFDLL